MSKSKKKISPGDYVNPNIYPPQAVDYEKRRRTAANGRCRDCGSELVSVDAHAEVHTAYPPGTTGRKCPAKNCQFKCVVRQI